MQNINNNQRQQDGSATNCFSFAAPKDIFEKCNICYNNGVRLALKETKEAETRNGYTFVYVLSGTVQLDSFISILGAFETESICFAHCECHGYDENDHRAYYKIKRIEDMDALSNYANPFFSFDAVFCDRETREYRFSLITDVGAKILIYCVEQAKYGKAL